MTEINLNDNAIEPSETERSHENLKETQPDTIDDSIELKEMTNRDSGDNIDDGESSEDNNGGNNDASVHIVEDDAQPFWRKNLNNIKDFRDAIGGIVNNTNIQYFIVVLILINALMMGIGTYDFVTQDEHMKVIFSETDKVFLIVFTIELGMQAIYHGPEFFLDAWLVFDLLIVTMSWVEDLQNFQILRALRIFRAFRLVTRIKVMKNLMLALFSVMPSFLAIALLLLLVLLIFGVLFTQLFGDGFTEGNYFSSLSESMFTLFQMTTMDNWANIVREVMEVEGYWWAWILFVIYVAVTGFIVVNLIIAVICDAISALHDDDKAKLLGTYQGEGDDGNSIEDDEHSPGSQKETQEQMESLEQRIEELSRIQEETMHTLENLTLQLQMRVMKDLKSDISLKDTTG